MIFLTASRPKAVMSCVLSLPSGCWPACTVPPETVTQVGEGVKGLHENDWVIPFKPHMGTWRSLAVWKAANLLKVPTEVLSIEHAALSKQLCLAYCLLGETKSLKVCWQCHEWNDIKGSDR